MKEDDLRSVGKVILGCPECGSHETIMIVTKRAGHPDESSIICMRCGHTVSTQHILKAARIWGTVGVFA